MWVLVLRRVVSSLCASGRHRGVLSKKSSLPEGGDRRITRIGEFREANCTSREGPLRRCSTRHTGEADRGLALALVDFFSDPETILGNLDQAASSPR